MRGWLLVLVAPLAGNASAAPLTITGEVADVRSRWTADGSRIVTEATVRTLQGDVVVSQLGGSVDGIGMRSWPAPEPLAPGMRASIAANIALDLALRPHVVVEGVKVTAYPPGYVRTGPTKAGKFLFWESGCVFVTVDSAGTRELAGDLEFQVIDRAIATWNDAVAGCSYLQLVDEGTRAVETGRDSVNAIKFRDSSWCRPATKDDPARCHPDSAAGITTATFVDDVDSPRDGAIVDADIELNGVNFAIAVDGQTLGTATCTAELQNTLTHELGHLLGLEHTCLAAGDPPRVDDRGRAVPSCSQTTDRAILDATMYNFQDCGEMKKETLEADDVNAICGIYPTANDPGTCERVGDGTGCCDSGRDRGGAEGALLVALAVIAGFWRPRARPGILAR